MCEEAPAWELSQQALFQLVSHLYVANKEISSQ